MGRPGQINSDTHSEMWNRLRRGRVHTPGWTKGAPRRTGGRVKQTEGAGRQM